MAQMPRPYKLPGNPTACPQSKDQRCDFPTSIHKSVPLKNKGDALSAMQAWERAQENETGLKIRKYRMGFDGELNSIKMGEIASIMGHIQ